MDFAIPLNYRNQALKNVPALVQTAASQGTVIGYRFINLNTGIVYVKFYDKVTAPTVGTDVPIAIIPVFASGVTEMELGSVAHKHYIPREFFKLGVWIAATTGILDSDNTAPAANVDIQVKHLFP